MYSTYCDRQKNQTKSNKQKGAQNQPTEGQKETPTLKLPNLEIHSLKK
jgi:hypothetical protein